MSGNDDARKQPQFDEEASEALAQAHRDQDTRELMEELESEAEQQDLLDAAEMAEQADKRQAEAEREQAKLDEANLELMKQEGFEEAAAEIEQTILDREAQAAQEAADFERNSLELEEAHLRQEGAIDQMVEHAGEVAGDQSSLGIERAGTTPTTVVQNVVIGVIAIATLIAGAALMRNRGRTPRPSAPASTSTSTKPPVSLEGVLRASIEVEYIHKFDWLDHRIKYSSTTEIGDTVGGSGTGQYREVGNAAYEGEPCSVTRTGQVTMNIQITPSLRELAAKIRGPVDRRVAGHRLCPANVNQLNSADIVCVFQDVDFVRGGRYRAEDHPPEIWDGNINQETCTMDLTPLGK